MNVAGVSVPVPHVSAVALDTTYAPMHVGVHDAPDAIVRPVPHVAELVTVGSVQGSGLHVNVAGVNVAAVHASAVPAEMVYPAAHVGAHDAPDATLPPAPHIAELPTVGNMHAFAEHDGGIPLHVPPTWHVYPAPLPTAVYPELHITPTVHVDPTATKFGPHVASSTLAESITVTPGPTLQWQKPGVPAHDPSIWHVYVAGVPAGVSPTEQLVVTAHVAPTATVDAPHAATPYVAPPAAAIDSAVLQAQTGAVPLHVPAVAWHVHVDAAAAIGDSPPLHAVVTVHVAPPAVVPHAAGTVCVAPAVAATVSVGQ